MSKSLGVPTPLLPGASSQALHGGLDEAIPTSICANCLWARSTMIKIKSVDHNPVGDVVYTLLSLRRGRDSNPRNAFGVYTLSRRASSTTRAPLRCAGKDSLFISRKQRQERDVLGIIAPTLPPIWEMYISLQKDVELSFGSSTSFCRKINIFF